MAKARPSPLWLAGTKLVSGLPGLAPTFLVVALLGCVLLPLPTALVDVLLSVSLAGAVLLLVGSLGIRRTTEFLNFPSLLLLATLFRLALNISTTRLILSEANAGSVVDAFAGVVVRGDLVVGGVMFAIITIVQYVVIARGAERVAEVGARFALDGLPGHQAAIDADLRAGVISAHEASLRRARLSERSNFYGAMDGAVRFVKGDAVAGLAITAVNLAGGLVIGVGRDGLGWEASLDTYARLTIGDGLLTQIPALLVSLAAGVLVSRVDRRADPGRPPAATWLDPSMLLVPATLLFALALVPTMPGLAFVTTGVGLVTAALLLSTRRSPATRGRTAATSTRAIVVRIHPSSARERDDIDVALAEVGARCSGVLGIALPPVELHDDGRVPSRVDVRYGDLRCGRASLDPTMPIIDQLVLTTYRAVMDHATQFIDLQELDHAIDGVRESHPAIASRAVSAIDVVDLLAVVRGFLSERIRLPPMRAILGAVAESPLLREAPPRDYPELMRRALVEHWIHDALEAMRALGTPRFVRLTPEAEEELLDHAVTGDGGISLSLGAPQREAWLQAIRDAAVGPQSRSDEESEDAQRGPVVLVATPNARRAAAALARGATPHLAVLGTDEARIGGAERPSWVAAP